MRKSVVALAVVLTLPVSALAQGQPAEASPAAAAAVGGGYGKAILVTTGIVGGLVVADILSGGTLTAPILGAFGRGAAAPVATRVPLSPAIAEARAAGAVLGEQITPATYARDVAARADMLYVGILGLGALAGGWLFSQFTN